MVKFGWPVFIGLCVGSPAMMEKAEFNFVADFFRQRWNNAEFSWVGLNEPMDLSRFWVKGHEK